MTTSHASPYIIITGACGFIGSGVVQRLNEMGYYRLILVDVLDDSEKWKNLVSKRFCELMDHKQLFDWLKGREKDIRAFIHLGACSDTTCTDSSYLLENNTRFSIDLAKYAIKNKIRFIYASSAATYGDGSLGFSDDHSKLSSLKSLNMYGYSKQLFDQWLFEENLLDQVVGLKYFNVFGPNEYHKGRMASAVMKLVPQIQKDKEVSLFASNDPESFADGEQKRDFIYVKDAVKMTLAFLDNQNTGIYNIGSGQANSWNHLAESVFEALELTPNICYIPMPADLEGKYQNYTCADMTKTKAVLKEQANCTPLRESIIEYVRDYLLRGEIW